MRRSRTICLGLYMLLLAAVSLLPGGEAAPLKWDSRITPIMQDIGHVLAYAILVLLALGLARASHRLSVARAVLIFVACCGLGALLEAGQWFIPGRTCSPSDALANVAGVAAGVLLWWAASMAMRWRTCRAGVRDTPTSTANPVFQPARVLYHHRTQAGGVEGVHMRGMIGAFEQRGIRVDVAGPPGVSVNSAAADGGRGRSGGGFLRSVFRWFAERMPQTVFEVGEILYNLYALPQMLARTWRGRYDIIYERYALFLAVGVLTARIRHLPIVVEVNDAAVVGERNRPLTFKRLARRIERWVLRNATVVVVVSRPFCEYLKVHQLDERRVVVVPNAVDPADWPENPLKARDRQGEDGAALRVGSVAAFVDWHRLDLLIEAFASLEPKENVRLVLVGDGPALPAAKAHAERLGCLDRVEFTGRVPHGRVRELLAGFNIAVTANSNDYASPVKIFEYMAAGCAIVAPAYPAIADVLADGETALLFPPLDEEAMREQLRRLVCEPQLRARLGRQARKRVLRHHTWSQNAQRVLGQLALVRLGRGANAARHTDLGGAS